VETNNVVQRKQMREGRGFALARVILDHQLPDQIELQTEY
jgi:hypothetical protein